MIKLHNARIPSVANIRKFLDNLFSPNIPEQFQYQWPGSNYRAHWYNNFQGIVTKNKSERTTIYPAMLYKKENVLIYLRGGRS